MSDTVPKCPDCDKRATAYRRIYDSADNVETGFRCKKCGTVRIPFLVAEPYGDVMVREWRSECLRLAGLVFDASEFGQHMIKTIQEYAAACPKKLNN